MCCIAMRTFAIVVSSMLAFTIKICRAKRLLRPYPAFLSRINIHRHNDRQAFYSRAPSQLSCFHQPTNIIFPPQSTLRRPSTPLITEGCRPLSTVAASKSKLSNNNNKNNVANESTMRPRASSSDSNNDFEPPHNRNTSPQQKAVPKQSPTILSTRALYQFRPIQPGSTREVPPALSGYDSYDDESYNDIAGEEHNHDDNNINVHPDKGKDDIRYDNSPDRESNFFDDEDDVTTTEPVATRTANVTLSKKEIQNNDRSLNESEKSISNQDTSMTSMSTPSIPRARARAVVTPSFMEPVKTKALINHNDMASSERIIPVKSSEGNGATSHLMTLTHQLEHLTSQIYQLNKGVEFNINSPKQVANVLFGEDNTGDTSTNKDVLEALASNGNEMA